MIENEEYNKELSELEEQEFQKEFLSRKRRVRARATSKRPKKRKTVKDPNAEFWRFIREKESETYLKIMEESNE